MKAARTACNMDPRGLVQRGRGNVGSQSLQTQGSRSLGDGGTALESNASGMRLRAHKNNFRAGIRFESLNKKEVGSVPRSIGIYRPFGTRSDLLEAFRDRCPKIGASSLRSPAG